MVLAALVLFPLMGIVSWLFFRASPGTSNKWVRIYNTFSFLLALGLIVFDAWTLRTTMGADVGWWPVVASLRGISIWVGILIISGLVRNYLLFRSRQ